MLLIQSPDVSIKYPGNLSAFPSPLAAMVWGNSHHLHMGFGGMMAS